MTASSISLPLIPTDILTKISEYLDLSSSLRFVLVCKEWESVPNVKNMIGVWGKERRACLNEGYPAELVDMLMQHRISIWRLPTIDLSNKNVTDYFDHLIKIKDMVFPTTDAPVAMAKFKDQSGRVGLALRVRCLVSSTFQKWCHDKGYKKGYEQGFKEMVWLTAMRYVLQQSDLKNWAYCCQSRKVSTIVYESNGTEPKWEEQGFRWVEEMIQGDDCFKISGDIKQIEPPPPTPHLPEPLESSQKTPAETINPLSFFLGTFNRFLLVPIQIFSALDLSIHPFIKWH